MSTTITTIQLEIEGQEFEVDIEYTYTAPYQPSDECEPNEPEEWSLRHLWIIDLDTQFGIKHSADFLLTSLEAEIIERIKEALEASNGE